MTEPDWLAVARKRGLVVEERAHVALPASVAVPKDMTEKAFTALVIEMAQANGFLVAHFRASQSQSGRWLTAVQGDGVGFPDIVLCRERVIFAELKSEKGRLRKEQAQWRDRLRAAGQEWYCFRPRDIEQIRRVLQ